MDYVELIQQEYEWADLPWKKFEKVLYKLQKRIYQASIRGNVKNIKRLQKLLINSRSAKLISVRKVSQDNQGAKTAGVDGKKMLTPKQRFELVDKINLGSKVSPVRRVWIPKPEKQETRPLGIPTIKDRAIQCLVKLALEPEWEAKFEKNSYGFRPGRSCHDAIAAIFDATRYKPKYVLDADISQCFDCINHRKLLQKLKTFPKLRKQIRAWLKAGVWDKETLFMTNKGVPQGGVLSPLLANIALHGMEEYIKDFAETQNITYPNGGCMSKQRKRDSISLIRYADDLVVLHHKHDIVVKSKEKLSNWLKEIGLELKPSKTRITHTLHNCGAEKKGFDFLGFNVQQYTVGKYNCGKCRGKSLGFKTLIKPSKKSILRHYKQLAKIITEAKSWKQEALIGKLNPIIRGWCNYFSIGVSKKVFQKMDWLIWWKLFKWGISRHNNKGKDWCKNKYFQKYETYNINEGKIISKNWIFATTKDGNIHNWLLSHGDTKIIHYTKVKSDVSPYDGNLIYWSSRMGKIP
ncbi:RNA-directed DNA polymerase (plasmid) [Chondrocystis sp. NIES-4102]|nr:RNA-directed DNA polymerase [Chondrocystis sp. NIES-4102]